MSAKLIRAAGDDEARPGRPATKVSSEPPAGFCRHDNLSRSLGPRGWYQELSTRLRRADIASRYSEEDLREAEEAGLKPVDDPAEMDRLMCRDLPVAVVREGWELNAATFNGRLVLDIDAEAHDDLLLPAIQAALDGFRARKPRRAQFAVWADHRILALLELQLAGHNLKGERKQLALWLFPEIKDDRARGDKFDRATEHLEDAIRSMATLPVVPNGD